MAEELATRLAALLPEPPPLDVAPLGLRDAFAAPARTPAETPAGTPPDAPAPGALPVRLYGRHAVLGPLPPGPGARGCARCLERRWQAARSRQLREAVELGAGTAAVGRPPQLTPFAAAALAGLLAARVRAPGRPRDIHQVDLADLTVRRYPLVPDPECPVCGPGERDSAEAATLELTPSPTYRQGADRTRPLDEYDLATDAFANPVCGALGPTVVLDVSSTSTSATIGCFSLRSGDYLRETFWGGHADTFRDSLRIGVLEGLERYAGMRPRARATTVRASLDALTAEGRPALDPRRCGLYPPEFHRRTGLAPFTPGREISWVWGYSLTARRPLLVPEVLTYYHTPGLNERFVQESSNGCASGGSAAEAVYYGLMEVVERDAFLLAWYGRQPLPELDPASSGRAATRQMVARLAMYGYRARFFDTALTFPIPVVTGVAERLDGGPGRMCFGAGAGLDPEAALASALDEIATDAVNLAGRTEREEPRLRAMAADFDRVAALHDHPLVYGLPEMARHAAFLLEQPGAGSGPLASLGQRFGGGRTLAASDDLAVDVAGCVAAIDEAGFEVVVVNQTLPEQRELGLWTVSVIVPGLLPIDFGWSRQRAPRMPRLRTGLREAGWRDHDLTDEEINPAPHPFP
ncbi:TOMM precursor leader peptide-binding protein [Streptomyces sp. 3MP-14]|uniref:TOMM leader peptide-binding protein n=1 Tax=Streptomyces mimosae TaxID=2586635 RepID=A0A5N6AD08_9ACTN|nr:MULTISPECIES: TOMM precursor leader peptide-binding protein [Streptomyces]KAB8166541.1 TOMM precursor leader peptide-binding protein [Streptomyces mimosae]KAB8174224.1 TOMM precursor leader peptide-binding protein [Streptomyces sp. 3MP-14]